MLDIKKLIIKNWDKVFLISESNDLSYGELYTKLSLIHYEFEKLNIKKDDRVAIISSNSEDYVIVFLALIFYGATAVPINNNFSIDGIFNILKNINCTHVLYDDNFSKLKSAKNKILSYSINLFNKVDVNYSKQHIIPQINFDRFSTIVLTSGSAGYPKGVVHSLGNHIYSALGSNLNIPFGEGDRWLLSLPLFHVGGIAIIFRALVSGGAVVLPKSRNDLLISLKMKDISHLSLVPTQLFRLIQKMEQKKNNYNLQAVLIGGDRISCSLFKKAQKLHLPLYLSYGSTEMSSQITTTNCLTELSDYISYGKPLKYREIKIKENGKIFVKGKTLFKGYVTNKCIDKCRDTNGWFETGDKGKFNADGNLLISGRVDNMFISGGENIHPEEIERCLEENDKVLKAVVVPVKDVELGDIPVVFIHSKFELKSNKKEYKKTIEQHLPQFKWPKYYFELPDSGNSMKINKNELIKLANKFIS